MALTAQAEQITGRDGEGAGRRPALDGLRAVAVGLVVAFHCSVDALDGGFVGVDVFFVLSGYLVTGVLLRDREVHGRARFGHFYARRVRRLLPASVVTLLVTLAVFTVLVSPIELEQITRATRAALLYVANWFFIGESTDYFADDVSRNPVLHMWSLAVEEQFYLLWPLLLTGLLVLGRRLGREPRRVAAVGVALGGLASLGAALALRASSPSQAYFGTGTRAYQLLAGALLALVPLVITRARRRPGPVTIGAVVALALTGLVATSLVDVDPIVRGVLTTVTTLVVIVGLEAAPTGLLGRALSLGPVVYLGQISYGTYLWHWPVVIALDELIDVSTPSRLVLVSVLACALAALSHRLLEAPIRTSPRLDRLPGAAVAVTGVALSVVAAVVLVPRIGEGGARPAPPSEVAVSQGLTPIPEDLDVVAVKDAGYGTAARCEGRPVEECTMVEGRGVHLLLIGDSNAEMLVPAFVAMARQEGLTFSTAINSGCPWQRGFHSLQGDFKRDCDRIREDAYDRVIPALDPDVIVTVDSMPGVGFSPEPEAERAPQLEETTVASTAVLGDGGRRRVVLVQPLPSQAWGRGFDPLPCLAEAVYTEQCRFTDASQDGWYRRLLDDLASDPDDGVTTLDISRLVCPLAPVCDPMVDGQVVFWNANHLTAAWSESMGPPLATILRAEGLLDPA